MTLLFAVGTKKLSAILGAAELRLAAGEELRFDLASGGCWYGHGFAGRQPYPLNAEPVVNEQFAVNNTQCPIWMCSAGYAILAETTARLEVRMNAGGNGVFSLTSPDAPVVVRVFRGKNLPEAQRQMMKHLGWPGKPPERKILGDSVFCTWTQYPRCITQERVLSTAKAIREHGYPGSLITIDDRWESAYGELRFSKDFPDPAGMMRELHAMGFRVLLWVTPFIDQGASTFKELAAAGALVRRKDGSGASLLKWWGGTAGLVDLTRPAGRDWLRSRLLALQREVGIDGFKIDGGDAKYQPNPADSEWGEYQGPSGYADRLLGLFEEVAPGLCETRTAWLSQRRHIIWRQGGKDSHWGIDNGLGAMVRLGLHMSLMGYDVFMPDMVPGRVQTMNSADPLPTDELLVRWTEASAFMPVMQFSYFPWNYAPETAAAVRSFALLHKALEPYLWESVKGLRRAPLLRPLWYDHPGVAEFYSLPDEWQLGSDLVAAPILTANQVARDVLLPPGKWRDAWTGEKVTGRRLLQHPAPCPGIPVFVREGNRRLLKALGGALAAIPRGSTPLGKTTATYQAGVNRDLNVTG